MSTRSRTMDINHLNAALDCVAETTGIFSTHLSYSGSDPALRAFQTGRNRLIAHCGRRDDGEVALFFGGIVVAYGCGLGNLCGLFGFCRGSNRLFEGAACATWILRRKRSRAVPSA